MTTLIRFKKQLQKRKHCGNLRTLGRQQALIDFASNDYLGLARSPALKQATLKEWETVQSRTSLNGWGSTGSRLLTGNHPYIEELEERLASFHGFEAALLFNSGYMANVGLISSVASRDDIILYDAHIHASTHDGMRLSKAACYPFWHNDIDHLEKRLINHGTRGQCFVCIESVYSIDGSIAPVFEMAQLCKKYGAELIVDEAHAVGLFGKSGEGFLKEKNLTNHIFAQITTFGKAIGAHGAAVLGSRILIEYLINFARSAIYTTCLPLQLVAAIKCAYTLLPSLDKERAHLQSLIKYFQQALPANFATPIQPFKVQGNLAASNLSHHLAAHGIDVRPLLSPTVKKGQECLRICLHAFNTQKQVQQLLNYIRGNND